MPTQILEASQTVSLQLLGQTHEITQPYIWRMLHRELDHMIRSTPGAQVRGREERSIDEDLVHMCRIYRSRVQVDLPTDLLSEHE